jgi:hypothetical protein
MSVYISIFLLDVARRHSVSFRGKIISCRAIIKDTIKTNQARLVQKFMTLVRPNSVSILLDKQGDDEYTFYQKNSSYQHLLPVRQKKKGGRI